MNNQAPLAGSPVERAARAAAQRLATGHQPGLDAEVEAALYARGAQQRPEQYFDPISLGSLIVSVATLAWTVYKDLRNKTAKPAPAVVERRVRIELPASDPAQAAERDKVIEVVVDEILKDTDQ
jgi:hypothetical protein